MNAKRAGSKANADVFEAIAHPARRRIVQRLSRGPAPVHELVRGAGFTELRVSWRNYQNEIETPEEFWDLHRTIRSDSRKRLLVAPTGVEDEVRREFMDECSRTLRRGGVMTFPISVVFVTATKPERAR